MGFVKSYEEIVGNATESADFHEAEMLMAVWETTPEAVDKLIPAPLKPVESPLVLAFVANYPSTNFSVPYSESALFLRASFEGQEGLYCLAMPVTDDMAMAGGREIFGYPKKMANIKLKRDDNTAEGWTERHGTRFMKIRADLTGKINDASAMEKILSFGFNLEGEYSDQAFNFKHFPSPQAGEAFDYPPRLIQQEVVFRPKEFIFAEVEVELIPSEFDPWSEVPVQKMLGGIYTVGNNSMLKAKMVAEVDSFEFAPHAFLKWEWTRS